MKPFTGPTHTHGYEKVYLEFFKMLNFLLKNSLTMYDAVIVQGTQTTLLQLFFKMSRFKTNEFFFQISIKAFSVTELHLNTTIERIMMTACTTLHDPLQKKIFKKYISYNKTSFVFSPQSHMLLSVIILKVCFNRATSNWKFLYFLRS